MTLAERAKLAAEFLNAGDAWRVKDVTEEYVQPHNIAIGLWEYTIPGSKYPLRGDHASVIRIAIVEGWEETKDTKNEAIAILSYKGRTYMVSQQFEEDYAAYIFYYWVEGNYADDYNRSALIKKQCDPNFPLLTNSESNIKLLCLLYNGVIQCGNTQGHRIEHVN